MSFFSKKNVYIIYETHVTITEEVDISGKNSTEKTELESKKKTKKKHTSTTVNLNSDFFTSVSTVESLFSSTVTPITVSPPK